MGKATILSEIGAGLYSVKMKYAGRPEVQAKIEAIDKRLIALADQMAEVQKEIEDLITTIDPFENPDPDTGDPDPDTGDPDPDTGDPTDPDKGPKPINPFDPFTFIDPILDDPDPKDPDPEEEDPDDPDKDPDPEEEDPDDPDKDPENPEPDPTEPEPDPEDPSEEDPDPLTGNAEISGTITALHLEYPQSGDNVTVLENFNVEI